MNKFFSVAISLLLILIFTGAKLKPRLMQMKNRTYSYLALGDSYTIGESVLQAESFPYQTVLQLRKQGFDFKDPEIIAKTGWATDELLKAMVQHEFLTLYDFVTLLIGVNNQYRGRKTEEYGNEFENLLKLAIQYTGGKNNHVIVLSIPDWGITPFAEGRDRKQIAREIDEYNFISKKIAELYKVNYSDITPGTREAANNPGLLAKDGLHPSGKEYFRWAKKTAFTFTEQLK